VRNSNVSTLIYLKVKILQ